MKLKTISPREIRKSHQRLGYLDRLEMQTFLNEAKRCLPNTIFVLADDDLYVQAGKKIDRIMAVYFFEGWNVGKGERFTE